MKLPKNTPAIDIVLIDPLEPVFGGRAGEINDNVIATFVLPLTYEERETETDAASATKIAGNATKLTPSMFVFSAVNVEIETPVVAAAAAAAFFNPANGQTT